MHTIFMYTISNLTPTAAAAATPEEDPTIDAPTPEEIEEIDMFYSTQRFTELREALDKYAALNNAEVLWRRARAVWEKIKEGGDCSLNLLFTVK